MTDKNGFFKGKWGQLGSYVGSLSEIYGVIFCLGGLKVAHASFDHRGLLLT